MLGVICSITGGQRDFFWFPKFDLKKENQQTNEPTKKTKKQPFLNTPEFIERITDLQNSMQFQFY